MSQSGFVNAKIIGSPALIGELQQVAAANPEAFVVLEAGPEEGTSYLQWGLGDVASIVAIIQGAYWAGDLAHKLYLHLKEKNEHKIVIQTPTTRIDLVANRALTEAEVKNALEKLVHAGP
jgi:hypothetical protein